MSKIINLKNIFKRRPRIVKKTIDDSDIPNINRDFQRALGYKDSQVGLLKRENAILKSKLEKKKEDRDINKELFLQRVEKIRQPLKGALSFRWMFTKNGIGMKNIKIVSYNAKQEFGTLYDIGILNNGLIAIMIKGKDGKIRPIIQGRDMKGIFRDFPGLLNYAKNKMLKINIDEKGDFAEDMLTKDVVDIIITEKDGNYKVGMSKFNAEPFEDVIINKNAYISELHKELETIEKTNRRLINQMNMKELDSKLNLESFKNATSHLAEMNKIYSEQDRAYKQMNGENATIENAGKIFRGMFDQQREATDEAVKKMGVMSGKPTMERARDDYSNVLEDIKDVSLALPKQEIINTTQSTQSNSEQDK